MSPDTRRLPLSARHDPEYAKKYEALQEGVPDWLHDSLIQWVGPRVGVYRRSFARFLWDRDQRARLTAALRTELPARISELNPGDLLDVIDYVLPTSGESAIGDLESRLSEAGSAWRATRQGLVRRVDDTYQVVAESAFGTGTRAANYLRSAWQKAWGRGPDGSAAYSEAVRAVEAAYAPIASPRNERATLGTIIADIRNKPSKFQVRLQADTPDANVERLVGMLQMLWKSQLDRHGTADESVPLNVSIDEARDAVALATTLVHLAQQGGFSASAN